MKDNGKTSLFKRMFSRSEATTGTDPAAVGAQPSPDRHRTAGMTEPALEQAYRNLMFENLVLQETNDRLSAELAAGSGARDQVLVDQQTILQQRDALAQRGRRMRELEYELKQLMRQHKKLQDEAARAVAGLAEQQNLVAALREKHRLVERELHEAKVALRVKGSEFRMLRDKYQALQREAEADPIRGGSVVNGDL